MKELNYIKHLAEVNGYFPHEIDLLVKKHSKNIKKKEMSTFFKKDKTTKRRVKIHYSNKMTNKLKKVYKKHNIEVVLSNNNKIKTNLSNIKDKTPTEHKSGIYMISCNSCSSVYVGQTRRRCLTRFNKHVLAIANNQKQKSAYAKHVLEHKKIDLNITQQNLKLLKNISHKNSLDAWESFYIKKTRINQNLINIDPEPIITPLFNLIIKRNYTRDNILHIT